MTTTYNSLPQQSYSPQRVKRENGRGYVPVENMASRCRCSLDPPPSALSKTWPMQQQKYGFGVWGCVQERCASWLRQWAKLSTKIYAYSTVCALSPLPYISQGYTWAKFFFQPIWAIQHEPVVLGVSNVTEHLWLISQQQVPWYTNP